MSDSIVSYIGRRSPRGELTVWRVEETAGLTRATPLRDWRELCDMGSGGFESGRSGRGAGQLALALLADRTDAHTAMKLCALFWRAFVRRLPSDSWKLPASEIDAWLRRQRWRSEQTGGAA